MHTSTQQARHSFCSVSLTFPIILSFFFFFFWIFKNQISLTKIKRCSSLRCGTESHAKEKLDLPWNPSHTKPAFDDILYNKILKGMISFILYYTTPVTDCIPPFYGTMLILLSVFTVNVRNVSHPTRAIFRDATYRIYSNWCTRCEDQILRECHI